MNGSARNPNFSQFFAILKNCSLRFAPLRFAQTKNNFASLRFAIFREKNFAFASLRNLILSDIWTPGLTISIGENLVLTVFALRFAPLTLGSYCTNPVSQVTLARTLSWCSVFGKGLLSLARGHVLITHCDFGPYTERTTPG